MMDLEQILVVNLGGIGDVLLSTPALRALKSHFPKTRISILVVPRVYEIVKDLSYIDKVFIFYPGPPFVNFFTLLDLRKKHFDLLMNMRTIVSKKSAWKMKSLVDIVSPKIKAGRNTDGRAEFFDSSITETLIGQKYEMDYDIEMVRSLGAQAINRNIDFEVDQECMRRVQGLLEKEGIVKETILIGIHPGGLPAHRWPGENFSKVMNEIDKRISCRFVVTGAKNEFGLAKKIIETSNIKAVNFAGQFNIKELGALIKRCHLYISNDTGPMHMAAILKTPLVALFGPGDVVRYDPRNISDQAIVLHQKADCAPCYRATCETIRCLRAISTQEVIEAALHLLELSLSS